MSTSTITGTAAPEPIRWVDAPVARLIRRSYWPVLIALTVLGIAAIAYRLHAGLRITAMTSNVSWGLWVALYIYFIGLSAGSFLLSSLVYVFGMRQYESIGRLALLSAVLALGTGLILIWIDLGHPWRVYAIFTRSGWASMMKIESWLYLLYLVIMAAELWLLMRADLARLAETAGGAAARVYRLLALGDWHSPGRGSTALKWVAALGVIGVPVAIGVHAGTGAIFAVVKAKPYWFTGLTPILFLISALLSGSGLMTFLYAFLGRRQADYDRTLRGLANLLALFVALDLLLVASEYLVGLYGAIPEHTVILNNILFGPYWYVFWIGQIGLAAAVPLVVVALPMTRRSPSWLGLAGLATVIGVVAVRLNLVIPAYLLPPFEGLDRAYTDDRLGYQYFPSFWEWATSGGAIALTILLFSIACRWLPVFPERESIPTERTSR